MAENLIILQGNLGRDSEMRYLPDATPVVDFSVATSRTWKDKESGERKQETAWFKVTVWGAYGEALHPHLKKGNPIYVVGALRPDKETGGPRVYERKDGTFGAQYEVTADKVNFVSGSGNGHTEEPPEGMSVKDTKSIPF